MNRQSSGQAFRRRFAGGSMMVLAMAGASLAADSSWPQWGGPGRDFIVEAGQLAESWPEEGPARLWQREIGEGYSGVLHDAGRLYTMYRDGEAEVVVALDAAAGGTLWEHRYEAPYFESQTQQFGGGPNATPLLFGGRLYTVGFTSRLRCLNASDGSLVWSRDLVSDFKGQVLDFGYASSPIVHRGRIIVLVGGERSAAVGFGPEDGEPVWKSKPLEISYGSPIVIDVDGQDQLVFMTPSEVAAVDLEHGNVLWHHAHENQYRTNCAGPWWGDGNLLFVSSQGDAGSRTLKITRSGDESRVEEVARDRTMKIFHNSAVRLGNWIYAGNAEALAAHDVRTGKVAWSEEGFPEANVLLVGSRALLLDEEGRLTLATISPEGLTIHARAQLLDETTWTAPTFDGRRLFVRGKTRLAAFDLAGPPAPEAE